MSTTKRSQRNGFSEENIYDKLKLMEKNAPQGNWCKWFRNGHWVNLLLNCGICVMVNTISRKLSSDKCKAAFETLPKEVVDSLKITKNTFC